MKKLHAFCDESGNTGSNYLDSSQPIYVHACWVVPDTNLVLASTKVAQYKSQLQETEQLRSKKLLKSQKGCAITSNVIRDLLGLGCLPIYTIVEKRYAIAALIVDTYLDRDFNPLAPAEIKRDFIFASELANLFCQLPKDTLHRFAIAYRTLDITELTSITHELSNLRKTSIPQTILRSIPGILPKLTERIAFEKDFRDSLPNNVYSSLNIRIFCNILYSVERFAEIIDSEAIVYHDSSAEFGQGFKEMFTLLKSTDLLQTVKLERNHNFPVPNSLRYISQLNMVDSQDTSLIQAADILAGLLSNISTSALNHRKIKQELIEVSRIIIFFTAIGKPFDHLAGGLVSDSFLNALGDLLYHENR